MKTVLECNNLMKSYGQEEAVRYVDLILEGNTIYGLLGRNGAGKTTLLNMISGSIFQDSGEIKVFGNKLKRGSTPKKICYIRENNLYFKGATVEELLEIASTLYSNWDEGFANQLLKEFKLNPGKKYKKLSRGMESMVGIIIGLASRAPLTVFDEPVLGLDSIMREKFYSILLEDYAENPRTILISTHLLDEIAKIIEKAFIIDLGGIVLSDALEEIRNKSYYVSGSKQAVEEFTAGKNVIHRESYGNVNVVAIFDTLTEQEKRQITKLGISLEGVPLQKFFTYFVEGRG